MREEVFYHSITTPLCGAHVIWWQDFPFTVCLWLLWRWRRRRRVECGGGRRGCLRGTMENKQVLDPWPLGGDIESSGGEQRRGGMLLLLERTSLIFYQVGMRSRRLLEGASKVMSFPVNVGQWETPLLAILMVTRTFSPAATACT